MVQKKAGGVCYLTIKKNNINVKTNIANEISETYYAAKFDGQEGRRLFDHVIDILLKIEFIDLSYMLEGEFKIFNNFFNNFFNNCFNNVFKNFF